jgi:hypothetical protein
MFRDCFSHLSDARLPGHRINRCEFDKVMGNPDSSEWITQERDEAGNFFRPTVLCASNDFPHPLDSSVRCSDRLGVGIVDALANLCEVSILICHGSSVP